MFFLTSLLIKLTSFFIKTFKFGNGFTWPGHLALKVFPNIWNSPKLKFSKGVILISGTNGKTTTSALLTHLLRSEGYKVTTNASGANLLNGILTSIFLRTNFLGEVTDDFAILEVDEFNLPKILEHLSPDFLILTNLSRDQLDRYGEVDTIIKRWREALATLEEPPFLILNKKETYFESLVENYSGKFEFFEASPEYLKYTPLVGGFNGLNLGASILTVKKLGISEDRIGAHLENFQPAFGRGERISKFGKEFLVFLAKNPASFNNNLQMLSGDSVNYDSLLFILNDKIPDGRDVSWIYDIDPVCLKKVCEQKDVYVAGTRSLDMQIRLNYASVTSLASLSDGGLPSCEKLSALENERIVVLPNYSAMLEFRQLITGSNIL